MRILFYVNINELEYLNKIIKSKMFESEYQITISPNYFESSYLVDIPYDDFVRLSDNNTFNTLISL